MPKRSVVPLLEARYFAAQLAVHHHFLPHFLASYIQNPAVKRLGFGVLHQPKLDLDSLGKRSIGLSLFGMLNEYRRASLKKKDGLKPFQFSYLYTKESKASNHLLDKVATTNDLNQLGQLRQFTSNQMVEEWKQAATPRVEQSRTLFLLAGWYTTLFNDVSSLSKWLSLRQDALFVLPQQYLASPENRLAKEDLTKQQQLKNWLTKDPNQASFLVYADMPEPTDWQGYRLYLLTHDAATAERFLTSSQQKVTAEPSGFQQKLFTGKSKINITSTNAEAISELITSQNCWTNKQLYEWLLKLNLIPFQEEATLLNLFRENDFKLDTGKKKLQDLPEVFQLKLTIQEYRKPEPIYRLVKPTPVENA